MGNMLLAAAILFSGSSPSKAITLFKHLKLPVISLSTYWLIQRLYLIPTVIKTWHATQSQMLCDIQHRQVVIGGDARCDSPGHSAKYGSYTLMDLETNHVLDIQLVQSNEVQNSSWMELAGLKRGLAFLKERNITVKDLVTDRHVQVKSYMSRQEKEINHFFDVWHCAKGVSKKLEKAAKKRDGASIRPWIKSITNHMYWVAGSSSSDGDLKEQKWLSILNHVADIHEGHGDRFARCAHEELMEDREWMSQGSRQHKMVKEVVASRYLVKDIRKLSPSQQTYGLEVFHNIILHFAPKHTHYFYWPMTARLLLAALHFNENANRSQAKTKAGVERWAVNYPKAKKGLEAVVKPIKNKSTYDYIETLFDGVVQRRMTLTSYKMAKADVQSSLPKPPDHVTSQYNGTVCKATLVQQRKSRFANLSAV